MWRWSWTIRIRTWLLTVFSTYVEMILDDYQSKIINYGILHVCGDDPIVLVHTRMQFAYSPRMWRWSFISTLVCRLLNVFSTYVEMILWQALADFFNVCILHVCGDDPTSATFWTFEIKYSPRMWRWSLTLPFAIDVSSVFSTYVEMILLEYRW